MPASGGKPKSLFKDINYSYSDGDQHFAWSPDSQYILANWAEGGGWNNEDVAVIEVESGKITNLTRSGYRTKTVSAATAAGAQRTISTSCSLTARLLPISDAARSRRR